MAGQSFTSQKSDKGMSSPWGEETGEGGRDTNQMNREIHQIREKDSGDRLFAYLAWFAVEFSPALRGKAAVNAPTRRAEV